MYYSHTHTIHYLYLIVLLGGEGGVVNVLEPHPYYPLLYVIVILGNEGGVVNVLEPHPHNPLLYLIVLLGDEGGVVNVLEPHPHYPFLAVSGLSHDVKLLMPVEPEPGDMSKHKKVGV